MDRIKKYACDAPGCTYRSFFKRSLKRHKETSHTPVVQFVWLVCQECGFTSLCELEMQLHMILGQHGIRPNDTGFGGW